MISNFNEKFVAYLALLTGIGMSAVAIFYSVSGLVAIYPTAVTAIIVMGVAIEIGKLSMTLWLKQNWNSPWVYKATMLPAVIILMLITSAGVFGFLSKAHSDQTLISGDVQSKILLYEERILIERENVETQRANIENARKTLNLLDQQVTARLGMGFDDGSSAERSVQIRRSQNRERAELQEEIRLAQDLIAKSNDEIAKINLEKAPIEAEIRKVEAEVGPIKYIAALIYGDNPDTNLLERAVRWFTILIVLVLDPVAILLLLASQYSFQQLREQKLIVVSTEQSIDEKFDPVIEDFEEKTTDNLDISINDIVEEHVDSEKIIGDYIDDELSKKDSGWIEATVEIKNSATETESISEPIFIQNEEQLVSNNWSNATSAISKEQYIETVSTKVPNKRDTK